MSNTYIPCPQVLVPRYLNTVAKYNETARFPLSDGDRDRLLDAAYAYANRPYWFVAEINWLIMAHGGEMVPNPYPEDYIVL